MEAVVRNGTNNKMLITIGVIAGFIVLVAAIIALVIIRRLWKRIIVLRDIQRGMSLPFLEFNISSALSWIVCCGICIMKLANISCCISILMSATN